MAVRCVKVNAAKYDWKRLVCQPFVLAPCASHRAAELAALAGSDRWHELRGGSAVAVAELGAAFVLAASVVVVAATTAAVAAALGAAAASAADWHALDGG